ncbi:hypothetical protein ACPS97_003705 [Providencia rettgeri]|uniref:hypothetical protein n=1 Tax=Providencia rettgeri TaxID=587 RepID=UPI0028828295|nr:hypothetical protein [Providencia rettgeri]ELM3939825.1 hypothetical protein [Providencia rettgeri]EMA4647488.1 hypothetical protein [Providencia rettgeri]MDK3108331.1 hypothetical protein [Providencia rettgeri]WRR95982.1 hypothetical protein VNI59_14595 [Providencia rettgeri]
MNWTEIKDGIPEKGVKCFVVRKRKNETLIMAYATRETDKPLTINSDASRDAWWVSCDKRSSFSDSTVIAWIEERELKIEYNGQLIPFPYEI